MRGRGGFCATSFRKPAGLQMILAFGVGRHEGAGTGRFAIARGAALPGSHTHQEIE
jgi:hypothetical protein